MPSFRDPIFRGCTRPATFAGVPMLPFLIVSGSFMIVTGWSFYLISAYVSLFLMMAYVPILIAMREVTKKDDQRLHQLLMRAKMRTRHRAGVMIWGAISYSPLRFKQRKGT
jgi:type IV secretion system protein VirB3